MMTKTLPMKTKPQAEVAGSEGALALLRKLVAQGEHQTLEFKKKAAHPEKIVRELIAFANASGGILLVGVDDDRTISGLKHPEEEIHVIEQALSTCKPALPIEIELIPIGNKRAVVKFLVSESSKKPHSVITEERQREAYVRQGDKSIRASKEILEILRRSNKKKDIRFIYGPQETLLIKYLSENPTITLKKFSELAGINRFKASRKLIILVLADVLNITPTEKGDMYSLAFGRNT